jgi:hypothetical protein
VVGQNILRVGSQQTFEFPARFLQPPLTLVAQRQQQSLIDKSVAEKHAAFWAELVSLAGGAAATGTAYEFLMIHVNLH